MKKEQENKAENTEKTINIVYHQFIKNIESVETFFDNFSTKALEEDMSVIKKQKKHFENAMIKTLGQEALDKFLEEIEKEENKDTKKPVSKVKKNKDDILIPKDKIDDFLYQVIIKAPKQQDKNFEILASGVFLLLNNHFEYLFADLLTFHFVTNKEHLSEKNINISLNDLENYSTIEEAYNDILFKEVEKILLDLSFDEIKNYFKKLDVSLSENLINWNFINEIRERRHIIVHNNNIVNKKYLTKTENLFNYKIGDIIKVDMDYLKKAIIEIKLAGIILSMNCWGKWSKETATEAIGELMNLTFELLQENRTELAKMVCDYLDQNITPKNDEEEGFVLRAKVNHCIALKRLNESKLLEKKLKNFRISSLSPIFKIAKHLLNNEHPESIPLFKQAILVDDLIIDDYLDWPMFEDLRQDEKYHKLALEEFKEKLALTMAK